MTVPASAHSSLLTVLLVITGMWLAACSSSSPEANQAAVTDTNDEQTPVQLPDSQVPSQPAIAGNNGNIASPPDGAATNVHQTDFLTAGFYTHLYPSFSNRQRQRVRTKLLESGYTHIYIYIMNQKDYGGPEFDFYPHSNKYIELLKELNESGLQPVVWLAPDDAPDLVKQYKPENLIATWERVIPQIDAHVSSYVLGLEMDEYWTDEQQQLLGSELNQITDKTIFVHMRSRVWEQVKLPWADGIIYQYGFGKTPQEIIDDTELMLQRLANYPEKVFIAGEYSHRQPEAESRVLGDAAMGAGALGFGNGGTPFQVSAD